MFPFLYFPEDKSEYLPGIIQLVLLVIAAGVAVYFFYKYSKKQEKKFESEYKTQLENSNKSNH